MNTTVGSINMFILLMLFSFIGWSKDVRTLTFNEGPVAVCGRQVPWQSLMNDLTSEETSCLDSLETSIVYSGDHTNTQIMTLSRDQIIRILKPVRSQCLNGAELKIPEKLQINYVLKLEMNFFKFWIERELGKNEAEKKFSLGQITLPPLDCRKISSLRWGLFRLESKNTFRFVISVDGQSYGGSGDFRVIQKLPIAKRNISPFERLSEMDFEIKERDVTFSPGYVTPLAHLIGKTVLRPVVQGMPVELKDIKPEYEVEKGQLVQIQFQGQNFMVTAMATAEQNGSVGDLIKIKNTETQKMLSGIVMGKGLVEVK